MKLLTGVLTAILVLIAWAITTGVIMGFFDPLIGG